MKYYNNIYKTVFALGLIAGCLSSCKEDIDLSGIKEDNYVIPQGTIGYVVGNEGRMSNSSVELRTSESTALYFSLTNDATSDLNATFTIDDAALESYNKIHGTNYMLFPKEQVSLENGGVVTVAKGAKKSTPLEIKIKSKEDLDANVTYVIPVKVKAEGVILSQEASSYLIFVNDYSKIPDCSKSTGIKIISCMEVNDTNPLNNLCFTLKGSGKPLVDMVILFSANINYSEENGRVYVYNNPNVQHLLSNRLKYIKPLQDRGIKVILGVLNPSIL